MPDVPLRQIATRANWVITQYVRDLSRAFTNTVKRHIRTPKKTHVSNFASGFHADVTSMGNAAGMLGFDHSFIVPPGGFKPKTGRAFAMEKPEGIVFRSRTYSRHSGATIQRTGTHSDAVRSQITGLRGVRRQAKLNGVIAGQVSRGIANAYKYELRNVPNTTVTVTTSGTIHLDH